MIGAAVILGLLIATGIFGSSTSKFTIRRETMITKVIFVS